MGKNPLKWFGDFAGSLIGNSIDFFEKVFSGSFIDSILSSIVDFLGFHGEDIYSTDVIVIPIFQEELYDKTVINNHLEFIVKKEDINDYIAKYANTGDSQFSKFYRYGNWDYSEYLPKGQISAVILDVNGIISEIKKEESSEIYILNIKNSVPTDTEWVKYNLQNNYNYNIKYNTLYYDNNYYEYINSTYDINNNVFIAEFKAISPIIKETIKITAIEITNKDENIDNKKTSITICYSTKDKSGNELESSYEDEGSTNEEIVKDTEKNSYNEEVIESIEEDIDIENKYIEINNHSNSLYYIVEYTVPEKDLKKYFIYDSSLNEYDIKSPNESANNFEVLPIVLLRNSGIDITDYNVNDKPSAITEKRCKKTEKILSSLGLTLSDMITEINKNPDIKKIQDGFFLIGVKPKDTHSIISKVLFELFDAVYRNNPSYELNTAYSFSVKANPYNSAIAWNTGSNSEVTGKIFDNAIIGDYKHSIANFYTREETYHIEDIHRISRPKNGLPIYWYFSRTNYDITYTYFNGKLIKEEITNNISNIFTIPKMRWVSTGDPSKNTKKLISTNTSNQKGLIICKQIDKNIYKEIQIRHLNATTIIRGNGFLEGNQQFVDSDNFVIPIPVDVFSRLTLMDKTNLLGRSMHLVFYAVEHTHLQWYQTGNFLSFLKFTMIIIIVVVTISSFGTASLPTLTVFNLLVNVLTSIAISTGTELALSYLTKFINDPILNSIIGATVQIVTIYFSSGISSGFNSFTALEAGTACIEASSMYMNGVMQNKFNALKSSIESFNEAYNEISDNFNSILSNNDKTLSAIDIFNLNNNEIISTMSPKSFFYVAQNRLAYNNEIIIKNLYESTVQHFVKNSLRLKDGEY